MTRPSVHTVSDGAHSVVIDESAFPIVVATWFGEPTEPLVEKYFAQHATVLDRARGERTKLVLITDTFATDRPSPKARKRIVDLTEAQPPDTVTLNLKSFIVIESAIMRGVVTALAWIYPKMSESENVASLELAFERGIAALRAAGITPPNVVPSRIRRPARPAAA